MARLNGPLALAKAIDAWKEEPVANWVKAGRQGIIQAVTGTGKTVMAIACMVEASKANPALRFAIVVPGRHLASQWRDDLVEWLGVSEDEVGLRMTGHRATYRSHRFIVWVLNTARDHLADACRDQDVMLVVDECHRAGADRAQAIFAAKTWCRLGISATASRPREFDDDGLEVPLERQVQGRALGGVVYDLTVAEAEKRGYLPPFEILHHGITLSTEERAEYGRRTKTIEKLREKAASRNITLSRIRQAMRGGGKFSAEDMAVAKAWQEALLARKSFLYRRPERNRVACALLQRAFSEATASGHDLQALLFNQRIDGFTSKSPDPEDEELFERAGEMDDDIDDDDDEDDDDVVEEWSRTASEGANQLYERLLSLVRDGSLDLGGDDPETLVRMIHTKHRDDGALDGIKDGSAKVLVAVQGLNEGIDVPSVDLGVVVASNSSVLVRIQTLGRILRPRRHEDGRYFSREEYGALPPKRLHVVYVKGTVDEEIYKNTDWEQLLGRDRNQWYTWDHGADAPAVDGAPPAPPMSDAEADLWVQAALARGERFPFVWPGRMSGRELRYTRNAVRVEKEGPPVHNSDEIQAIIDKAEAALRLTPGELRSVLHVTQGCRWIIKRIPEGVVSADRFVDPRTGAPLRHRMMVLGQVAEWPRVQTDSGTNAPRADAVRGTSRVDTERHGVGVERRAFAGRAAPPADHGDALALLRRFVASGGKASSEAATVLADANRMELGPLRRLVTEGVAGDHGVRTSQPTRSLRAPALLARVMLATALGNEDAAAQRELASRVDGTAVVLRGWMDVLLAP